VVALPDQLFYNTGISTYFWIVSNRKTAERRGKVQLIDARELFVKNRKSLGEKRKEISDEQIAEITRLYADFTEGDRVKIFPNEAFGYLRITVERPLRAEWRPSVFPTLLAKPEAEQWMRDQEVELTRVMTTISDDLPTAKKVEAAIKKATTGLTAKQIKALVNLVQVESDKVVTDAKGNPEADTSLRDNENVLLPSESVTWSADVTDRLASDAYVADVEAYLEAEVLPYVPDAWVDFEKTKIGYEIPLTRHFYRYVPPRPLAEIDEEIKALEAEIQDLLGEVTE